MHTAYIRFVMTHNDPVWGPQALPGMQTQLIRVTRNRLKKSVFEYVGWPGHTVDVERLKKTYPIVIQADLENSGCDIKAMRKVAPLP